jgi:hypothetical protein
MRFLNSLHMVYHTLRQKIYMPNNYMYIKKKLKVKQLFKILVFYPEPEARDEIY